MSSLRLLFSVLVCPALLASCAGQNLTTDEQIAEARAAGLTGRIVKYSPDGEFILEWGEIGTDHGQFRTPHALEPTAGRTMA